MLLKAPNKGDCMREMVVATNEVVVFTNSTVVRALGRPALTVKEVKRQACAKCHMIPGSAEPMTNFRGKPYHESCGEAVRAIVARDAS